MDKNVKSTSSTVTVSNFGDNSLLVTTTALLLFSMLGVRRRDREVMAPIPEQQVPNNNMEVNKQYKKANNETAKCRLMQQINQAPTHTKQDVHHNQPHVSRFGKR